MKRLLQILALASLAALGGLSARALAAEPKFGPEIELLGKKQKAVMLCFAALPVSPVALGALAPSGALSVFHLVRGPEAEESGGITAEKIFAASSLTSAAVVLCAFQRTLDEKVGDGYLLRLASLLEERAQRGELTVNWIKDGHFKRNALVVDYANGRRIIFSQDPSVMELKLPGITAADFAEYRPFYQKELFDLTRRAGLRAPLLDGPWNGGHVHIDVASAFDSDPSRLRNFLLDFVEHPELADGVLVWDKFNAAPISPDDEGLAWVLHHLDRMIQKKQKLEPLSLQYLSSSPVFGKQSALNINPGFGTLEIRSLRSYRDARQLADTFALLEARIKHTNGIDAKPHSPWKKKPMSRAEKAAAFRRYVEETGLDYEKYKYLSARRFREPGPGCPGFFSWVSP